eukprot:TRINITY_DN3055_c0_g1_i25.p1 TRINITY_DN3055_c0_g1~~TRINITY_DN3055_c0_g1_i25.p1  ORF type:complete len:515 (+),score=168.11 TRINITY_DN3055_c0_g1_i25:82-1545(+)
MAEAEDPLRNLAKSEWLSFALEKHPEVVEMRERLRPLSSAPSYGRQIIHGRTEVKETLSHKWILQAVMEYLESESLANSRKLIEQDARVKYDGPVGSGNRNATRLVTLCRVGTMDIKELNADRSNIDTDDHEIPYPDHIPDVAADPLDKEEDTEDTNIWEEKENFENGEPTIIMKDQDDVVGAGAVMIIAGTLNRLISALTYDKSGTQYKEVFLLTYQTFTNPEILLRKLIQLYHVPNDDKLSEEENQKREKHIQLKVCNILKTWLDKYLYDFNDKLLSTITKFIDTDLTRDRDAKAKTDIARQMRNIISRKVQRSRFETARLSLDGKAFLQPKVPKNVFSSTLSVNDVEDDELARQITLIDARYFANIQASEFLFFHNHRMKNRFLNIQKMNRRDQWLTEWAISWILSPIGNVAAQPSSSVRGTLAASSSKQSPVKIFERVIKIAEILRSYNNFFAAAALVRALVDKQRLGTLRDECGKKITRGAE